MTNKKRKAVALPGSFSEVFQARVDKIQADAKAVGANWSIICKLAKISRANPVRWREQTPLTIRQIDLLEKVVKRLAEKKAKALAQVQEKAK